MNQIDIIKKLETKYIIKNKNQIRYLLFFF